jgi:hypothetical protein
VWRTVVVAVAVACVPSSYAEAQNVLIAGALQIDVQRFAEDVVPSRLDGSGIGWTTLGRTQALGRLALDLEWSDGGTVDDVRSTTLDLDGRSVTIHSTFTHRTRTLFALAGYTHSVWGRARIAYLGGAAFTEVRRTFTSDAARLVLVRPSDPSGADSVERSDRFSTFAGGVDVTMSLTRRVGLVVGTRLQKMPLEPDVTGWSLRTFAGAGWIF